ncbi:MAG: response regulator [Pseudomonadota bacterium]
MNANTILIVEDNQLNKKLFEDILKVDGYKTVATENAFEAQELAIQHKVSLVLMDIQLPEISGLDVIAMFKRNKQLENIPIIAVTAFAMKGDEEHILSQGASAYLSKPITVSQLLAEVRRFLPKDEDVFGERNGTNS